MPKGKPVRMLCLYRVKDGRERAFQGLLARHWPALRSAGLASAEPAVAYRTEDRQGRTVFVELFSWADAHASDAAHRSPDVMAVWAPMGELAAEMEFLELAPEPLPRLAAVTPRRKERPRPAARAGGDEAPRASSGSRKGSPTRARGATTRTRRG
jgi:quinol monooxygenase YgiN